MFNPKQALQRLRKAKLEQQDRVDTFKLSTNDKPLFPESSQTQPSVSGVIATPQTKVNVFSSKQSSQSLQERMSRLESLVLNLNSKLAQSNQVISQLKKQNSTLQSQVLKLQHQNSQLKNQQKYQQTKNSLVNRLNNSISTLSENTKVLTGLTNQSKSQIRKAQSKVVQDEVFSPQVQDAIQQIKKQPIADILKRKQHNFRALKNASKQSLAKGQKALRQLAILHKQYGKNYKKPTLIINLTDADFE